MKNIIKFLHIKTFTPSLITIVTFILGLIISIILINYLDSLTLIQEGGLFHIMIFSTILVIIFDILGIFFGNEIIKYFNIENKFPSLSNFFKLRAELQRYYLMWNITILFVLSIGALGINILVFNLG